MNINRRLFLFSMAITGASIGLGGKHEFAEAAEADQCMPGLDFVATEATYFARYEHYHLLALPISVLIEQPQNGYTTRTTTLDQGSLDEKAFEQFIKETKLDGASLRRHSHEVKFSFGELQRIANGEENVEIVVKTPKGNLGHRFYFTASKSALIKVRRGRESLKV